MTQRERRGWFLVASLFITLLLIFGSGYNTAPVFQPALLRYFKWSHARVATLPSVLAVSFGLSAPLVGWLLDRVEARLVIIAGAAAGGLAFLVASQSNSFGLMLVAYLGIGVAVAAGTVVPASFVIANWFEPRRRGLAMGVTFAGTTVGGAVMTQVVNYSIQYSGWRAAYAALAVPAFVVVIPLVFIMVRSRPPGALQMTVAAARAHLPGLETSAAVRTRSFWMIVLAQFCFAFAAAGAVIHLVTYLEGVGYSRSGAAWVMSCVFALTSVGKVSMGMFADRASARIALTVNFIAQVIGLFLALGAHNTAIAVSFILVFGLTAGPPLMLIPLLIAESMGLKRYGSISGLIALVNTLGAALGPLAAGWIFDATLSYTNAFELFMGAHVVGALASYTCRPLAAEEACLARAAAASASASA